MVPFDPPKQEGLLPDDERIMHCIFENLKSFEDDASIRLLFVSALFNPGNVLLDDDERSCVQHFQQKANILVSKYLWSKHPRLEYSKILRETTRFAEMLENINKISISMIQPVKSSFALPLVTPMVDNFHYDINTQPSPFTQEDNLEEICQQF